MKISSHFNNIQDTIKSHLETAQTAIHVAVAWFTDSTLFDVLCQKASLGISVNVILIEDEINLRHNPINFNLLKNLGGNVKLIAPEGDKKNIMHHKFCIIDFETTITGSYNWSKKAQGNSENITIIQNSPDFSKDFIDAFNILYHEKEKFIKSKITIEDLDLLITLIKNRDINYGFRT